MAIPMVVAAAAVGSYPDLSRRALPHHRNRPDFPAVSFLARIRTVGHWQANKKCDEESSAFFWFPEGSNNNGKYRS